MTAVLIIESACCPQPPSSAVQGNKASVEELTDQCLTQLFAGECHASRVWSALSRLCTLQHPIPDTCNLILPHRLVAAPMCSTSTQHVHAEHSLSHPEYFLHLGLYVSDTGVHGAGAYSSCLALRRTLRQHTMCLRPHAMLAFCSKPGPGLQLRPAWSD